MTSPSRRLIYATASSRSFPASCSRAERTLRACPSSTDRRPKSCSDRRSRHRVIWMAQRLHHLRRSTQIRRSRRPIVWIAWRRLRAHLLRRTRRSTAPSSRCLGLHSSDNGAAALRRRVAVSGAQTMNVACWPDTNHQLRVAVLTADLAGIGMSSWNFRAGRPTAMPPTAATGAIPICRIDQNTTMFAPFLV